jgi:CheY-like chemotaxis protein
MSSILTNTTILVVEDDEDTREFLRTLLEDTGANVLTADSAETALASYRLNPPDVIVSDSHIGVCGLTHRKEALSVRHFQTLVTRQGCVSGMARGTHCI